MIITIRILKGKDERKIFVMIEEKKLETYSVDEVYLTNNLTGKTDDLTEGDETVIDADRIVFRGNKAFIYIDRPHGF